MPLIEKEMNAAQHLLYVSLKYTKTGDVILNLLHRWKRTIDAAMEALLTKAKKKKRIKTIPLTPIERMKEVKRLFRKEKTVQDTLKVYMFFRRVHTLELSKEHEFRKNVTLRVFDKEEMAIDMEKLKEWSILLEDFIKFVRNYTA